ncbi:MAG TPA: hypothetical protein VM575_18430 [Nocardioides sp.]|nr:hypothetical protein [Nocardioides sp.]
MTAGDRLALAVVGAHLAGMPLNGELVARGAVLRERTASAPSYRLYHLAGVGPARPGLVRVATGGSAIDLEVWDLPTREVGTFLRGVPAPLAIGTVLLASGEAVSGFVCEPIGLEGARDITGYGGWRAYLAGIDPVGQRPAGTP